MENRFDYKVIIKEIEEGSKVLDLGCGSGELLSCLKKHKKIDARGIELKQDKVRQCIEHGLSVLHGDIDEGLKHYGDKSFDYVVFCETIQVVRNSLLVLEEALRVGKKVIVSFPNFGHYTIRFPYFFFGKMPKSSSLPYEWYNTPNIREVTIKDFRTLCRTHNIKIIKEADFLKNSGKSKKISFWPNLLASNSIFIMEK